MGGLSEVYLAARRSRSNLSSESWSMCALAIMRQFIRANHEVRKYPLQSPGVQCVCTQDMAFTFQITIDSTSPVPAYRQIVDQMRVLIVDRQLSPGSSLPPVRSLARELGVHHNTVAEAYRTLAAEALISITHGRGAIVAVHSKTPGSEVRKESLTMMRRRLREMVAEYRSQGLSARQIAAELRGLTEALEI